MCGAGSCICEIRPVKMPNLNTFHMIVSFVKSAKREMWIL